MTDFEIFQAVRDAYLSRYNEGDTSDIFGQARARCEARDLGLDSDAAAALVKTIRLQYGPKKYR